MNKDKNKTKIDVLKFLKANPPKRATAPIAVALGGWGIKREKIPKAIRLTMNKVYDERFDIALIYTCKNTPKMTS